MQNTNSQSKLIVFTGLPGTGKTTVAEAVARHYAIPIFAKDWLESVLLQCGLVAGDAAKPLGYAGYELLKMLAARQLSLGQSVILDSVVTVAPIRTAWKTLCWKQGADWYMIECVCSDEAVHRERLERRQRNIPGWPELAWSEVERVRANYASWENEPRLILDAMNPLAENIRQALAYVQTESNGNSPILVEKKRL